MFSLQAMSGRSVASNVTALLAWIDELGKLGLDAGTGGFDGQSLNEIGITNGSLTIDDRRSGTEWKFTQISLNLNRPKAGGVALTVLSESQERPWAVSAALSPAPQGHRRLQLEARKVVLDDLLALRMSKSKFRSDTLVSASIDADIAADGTPQTLSGSIYAAGRFDRQSGRSRTSNSDHQRRIRAGLGCRAANVARAVQGHRRSGALHACAPNLPRPRCPAATGCLRSAADGSCSIR